MSRKRTATAEEYRLVEEKYRDCRLYERRISHIAHPMLAEGYGNLASRFSDMSYQVIIHVLQPYLMWHGQDRPGVVDVQRVCNPKKRLTATPLGWRDCIKSLVRSEVIECFSLLPEGLIALATSKDPFSVGDQNLAVIAVVYSDTNPGALNSTDFTTAMRLSWMDDAICRYSPLPDTKRPRGIAVMADGSVVVARDHNLMIVNKHSQLVFGEQCLLDDYGVKEFGGLHGSRRIRGMTLNRDGNILVHSRRSRKIRVFDPSGRLLRTVGLEFTFNHTFVEDVCVDPSTGNVFVLNSTAVRVYDASFNSLHTFQVHEPASCWWPHTITMDGAGRLLVVSQHDYNSSCAILIFDSTSGLKLGMTKMPRDPSKVAHRSLKIAVDACGRIVMPGVGGRDFQFIY